MFFSGQNVFDQNVLEKYKLRNSKIQKYNKNDKNVILIS